LLFFFCLFLSENDLGAVGEEMARTYFIIVGLVFGLLWASGSCFTVPNDELLAEKEVFLREKGRLPTPDPQYQTECSTFLGSELPSKLQQMQQAQDPFLFSQAGLEFGGPEDQHIDSNLLLAPPSMTPDQTGYTRFAFLVPGTLANNQTRTFNDTFLYVADPSFSKPACSTVSSECDDQTVCETVRPFTVEISVGKMRGEYQLTPQVFGPVDTDQLSRLAAPFMYYPVDEYEDDISDDAATLCSTEEGIFCTQGTLDVECRTGHNTCEPATIFDSVDPAVVEAHCGDSSDPVGDFDARLNQHCVVHCCPDSVHRRWAAGPRTYLLKIGDPKLVVDLNVTVHAADIGGGAESKTVTFTDAQKGDGELADDGGMRVLINDIVGNLQDLVPRMLGGALIVWVDGDDALGALSQTNDPNDNPHADEFGFTPTRINIGGDFGWAFLDGNARGKWGTRGYYGTTQAWTTLPLTTGFGLLTSCTNDTYQDYVGVPGWQIDPTLGVPLRGDDPCTISHYLNVLSDAVATAGDPSTVNLTLYEGSQYLPTDYNLAQPNYYIANGLKLIYEFFPDSVAEFPNLIVRRYGSVPTNWLRNVFPDTRSVAELFVDLDESFITRLFRSGSAEFGQRSCAVGLSTGNSTLFVEIGNPSFNNGGEYVLASSCFSDNASDLVVTGQPANETLQVTTQQKQQKLLRFTTETLETNSTAFNATVTCTVRLFDGLTLVEVSGSPISVECVNYGTVTKFGDNSEDGTPEDGRNWGYVGVVIGAVALLVIAIFVGLIVYATQKSSKKKAQDAWRDGNVNT
jgi:hypothetical protein